jgi:hypothetical protein
MLKNDSDVLADLKALYVMAKATMPQEERKFFMLALFAVATQWGIEAKFSNVIDHGREEQVKVVGVKLAVTDRREGTL